MRTVRAGRLGFFSSETDACRSLLPAAIPPVGYQIRARWPDGQVVDAGNVWVEPGELIELRCAEERCQ